MNPDLTSFLPEFIVHDGGVWLPSMWIRPERVERDLDHYLAAGLEGIECDGSLIERVSSLRPRHLRIRGLENDAQLQALHGMPWLEEIAGYSAGRYRPAIEWGRFPRLRRLSWNWTPKLRFPEHMLALEHLQLMGMKLDPGAPTGLPAVLPALLTLSVGYFGHRPRMPDLPAAPRLEHLDVAVAHTVDLTPILAYRTLRSVTLHHLPHLTDLRPLAELPCLTTVHIQTCKRLSDLSPLGRCPKLHTLVVEGCTVSSLGWVDVQRTKAVRLVHSNVVDGNLAPLIGVDEVSFDFRPHYSHREEEVRAATTGGEPALVQWAQGRVRFTITSTAQCEAEVDGVDLPIVLWNAPGVSDRSVPERVLRFLEHAPEWDRAAHRALRQWPPECVRYLRHHGLAPTEASLDRLHLSSVDVWDDSDGLSATLDYTVGPSLTQYVLAVRLDADAHVTRIDVES